MPRWSWRRLCCGFQHGGNLLPTGLHYAHTQFQQNIWLLASWKPNKESVCKQSGTVSWIQNNETTHRLRFCSSWYFGSSTVRDEWWKNKQKKDSSVKPFLTFLLYTLSFCNRRTGRKPLFINAWTLIQSFFHQLSERQLNSEQSGCRFGTMSLFLSIHLK